MKGNWHSAIGNRESRPDPTTECLRPTAVNSAIIGLRLP
jgi:hypothetical protein